jgi:hypothetical protein
MLALALQRLQYGSADSQNQEPPKNLRLTSSGVALNDVDNLVERETGFEPATSTLARLHSTTELFPQHRNIYYRCGASVNPIARAAIERTGEPVTL